MTYNTLNTWLSQLGLRETFAESLSLTLIVLGILVLAILSTLIVRRTVIPVIVQMIQKNNFRWYGPLI
ncbi:hypothetical protein JYT52_01480, partial [Desulfotalea psychrophila]|nr:hypothetical protein [Desulfotalea psychrophila]